MEVKDFIGKLEIESPSLMELNTENRVLWLLFNEYALSKNELYGYLGEYPIMPLGAVLRKMNVKGYVYIREAEMGISVYSLTSLGLYEVQRRFNNEAFHELFDYLLVNGYDSNNVSAFLRNKFYGYHINGIWEEGNLETQYLEWCQTNGIESKSGTVMKKVIDNL